MRKEKNIAYFLIYKSSTGVGAEKSREVFSQLTGVDI
jgi:hypothetical protein